MKNKIVLVFGMLFIALLMINLVSATWCYQETANVSTACGGLDTGVYNWTGSWVNGGLNLFDENWLTGDTTADTYDSLSVFYINYSKSASSTSAIWQEKNTIFHSSETINITILNSCFSQTKLQLKAESFINHIDLTHASATNYYCWNGTWQLLRSSNSSSTLEYARIYEEAIWWNEEPINISACGIKINSSGNYQLINNITNFTSQYGCIDILANNVNLDGQGFMINMSDGYAITSYNGTKGFNINNIIVKNFLLYSNSSSYNAMYFGNSTNNTIIDNITIMNNSLGDSIIFNSNTNNITISNFYRYLQSNNYVIQYISNFIFNNVTIKDSNIITDTGFGSNGAIRIGSGASTLSNIKIQNNNFTSKTNGFIIKFIDACSNCTISGNRFVSNASTYSLINFNMIGNNLNLSIYNNLLYGNSTNKYFVIANSTNAFLNTSNQSGTNIAGGNRIGGNFYYQLNNLGLSQTCLDNDNDQFCDSIISFNFGNLTDYLPLASSGRIIGLSPANNTASLENEKVNFTAIYQANSVCISDVNASFKYDGVYYNPIETKSDNNYTFRYELLIPSITGDTATKLWSFNFSIVNNSNCEYSNQSDERTFRVSSIGLSSCAGIYNKTIMNFTLKDEKEQTITQMNNMSRIEAHVILISPTNSSFYKSYNISVINNTNLLICGQNMNYTNYRINATLIFEALNHVVENYYYDNFSITNLNIPQNVTLFDLAITQSTSYLVTVQDEDYLYLSNAVIELWRYYIGEGVFKIVEMAKTDEHGQTRLHLVSEDATYRILIRKGNQLLWTTTDFLAICQATPCQININIGQEQGQFYDPYTKDNIAYTLDFNEGTREVTLTFNTLDGSSANVELNLTKVYNNEGVCYNSTSLAGGTLVCSVPLALNNASYNVLFSKDGQLIDFDSFNLNPDAQLYFGDTGIVMAGITVLTLSLMAISNGVLVMVFAVIGLITASSLLILKMPYGTLIYIVIAIIIIIIKFTKKQDGV